MAAGQIVIEILGKSGAFISDTARAEKSLDSFRKSVGSAGDAFKYLQAAVESANKKIASSETETAEKRLAAARRILEIQGESTGVRLAEVRSLQEAGALTDTQFRKASAAIDIQNGLTKSYREQLLVLRQLRDAGQITPTEFKQAGAALVAKQPISIARAQEDREAKESAAIQVAAAQKIVDAQNGLTAAYRQQLVQLRELRDAGALTPAQFKQAGTELVSRQPISQKRQAEADDAKKAATESVGAIERVTRADLESATQRTAATQRVIDQRNGLTASYRAEIAALRELRNAKIISEEQFGAAKSELVSRQPAVQQRAQEVAAAQVAAGAQVQSAEAVAQAEVAAAEKRKVALYSVERTIEAITQAHRREVEELKTGLATGAVSPAQAQARAEQLASQQAVIAGYRLQREAADKAAAGEAAAAERAATAQVQAGERILASLRERIAAAGKSREFLDFKVAKQAGVGDAAQPLFEQAKQVEFVASIEAETARYRQLAAEIGLTKTQVLQLRAAQQGSFNVAAPAIQDLDQSIKQLERLTEAKKKAEQQQAASDSFVSKINEQIAAEQRLAETFGKTEIEVLRLDAAQRGMANSLEPAIAQLEKLKAANAALGAATATPATKADAFIADLIREREEIGKTREQLLALKAARLGIDAKVSGPAIAGLGDAEFISGIHEKIEAEQRLADQVGKTTAEMLQQQAAERGLTNTTASAIARFDALAKANKATADQAVNQKSADAFVDSVNRQANAIGKLPSQLLAEEAALKGVTAQTQAAINKMSEFEKKTGQAGKGAFATANQLQTLKYTLSDIVASAGSGISPFTILLQQGPQLAQVEGGISGIFKTVVSLVTPARIAMGAFGATIGAVAFAWYKGHEQSKAFNDALVLSGNYAGQTEGKFNALAKSIAASGQITTSAARSSAQALLSTGEVGPLVFVSATEATARFAEATGKTEKDVAADFATMGRDVARWAVEHNRSLNFVTAAQYDQIKTLQDQGRAAEAQAIVYDALNTRLRGLDTNLGYLDRALKTTKSLWGDFWNAAFDVGRSETIEDKVARTAKALANIQARKVEPADDEQGPSAVLRKVRAASREKDPAETERQNNLERSTAEKLAMQSRRLLREEDNAFANAERAATTKRAIDGKELVKSYQESGKAGSAYAKALDELTRSFKDNADAGTPFSEKAKAEALAGLQEKFKNRAGSGEADAQRKSNLAKSLEIFKIALDKEKEALVFHQSELQSVYAAGNISLQKFYDDKEKTTRDGAALQIKELKESENRLRKELAGPFKDPHERTDVETKLLVAQAETAKAQTKAENDAKIATYERAAAVKELAKQVENFQANLLQLSGDEFGAAQIRTRQVLADAQEFARKATPLQSTGDVARFDRAKEAGTDLDSLAKKQFALNESTNLLAEVQRRVGVATADAAREEEAYGILAQRTGASLLEQDSAVFSIRLKVVDQLREAARATRELADARIAAAKADGTVVDPKILADAANAALNLAKALDSMDPALNRLRETVKSTADSITDDIGNAINDFKGFRSLIDSIEKDLVRAGTKLLVTDKLKVTLEGVFEKFTEGDNPFGNFLKDVLGIGGGGVGKDAALVNNTSALERLTLALTGTGAASPEASAMSGLGGWLGKLFNPTAPELRIDTSGAGNQGGINGGAILPNILRGGGMASENETSKESLRAAAGLQEVSVGAAAATSDIVKLARSAGLGGNALAVLPSIVQAFAVSTSAASGSSSGGGIFSLISGLFGSSNAFGGASSAGFGTGAGFGNLDIGAFLSEGTDRVPYDGFRAVLHKDERVVPAKFNPAIGNGNEGGDNHYITVNVQAQPGMSRQTAMQQGRDIGQGIQRAMARNG